MIKTATISECGLYRYNLTRTWDDSGKKCLFIMYNPSTADADIDDPTIRRCISFAKKFGCGSLEVVNLHAFRATNPKELLLAENPIGPHGTSNICKAINQADLIIYAWGNNKIMEKMDKRVDTIRMTFEKPAFCLKKNKDGSPAHPLYLSFNSELIPISF